MPALSILIPARNEQWLPNTVADLLAHARGDTEIIVALDGTSLTYALPRHPRVRVLEFVDSIGQRAATNAAARASTARYVMKVDAHCAFDDGFDVKLMADTQDDWTVIPIMRNLHAFDWVCAAGHRRYQSPSGPCDQCGKPTEMVTVWNPKTNPSSKSFCFDPEPHFQYFGEFNHRPEGQGELTETMCLQGSAFMLTRARYHALDICGEEFGSWGSQGIEVACKTWLSGGKCMVNQKTWYAHLFRTQGGDFSFPYHMQHSQQERAKHHARDLFFGNKWPGQTRPLSWLVRRFWPVAGWKDSDLAAVEATEGRFKSGPSRGIIYYTDGELPETIAAPVRERLKEISRDKALPIVTAALKRRLAFGERNIVFPSLKRGHLSMFKQILGALENSRADVVFFAEHDVLYHESHFDFTPPDRSKVYYNTNVYQVRATDGHAVRWDAKRVSQLCGYRDVMIEHYRKRVARVERDGYSTAIGFEPGSHHRAERIDDLRADTWHSAQPNIDIKHGGNITPAKWTLADFRTAPTGWQEAESVPGWGAWADALGVGELA